MISHDMVTLLIEIPNFIVFVSRISLLVNPSCVGMAVWFSIPSTLLSKHIGHPSIFIRQNPYESLLVDDNSPVGLFKDMQD